VAEGLETALAVAQACSVPAWAALSADGIRSLILPPEARMVTICADNDRNGVGPRAAGDAAVRFVGEGRRCRIAIPLEAGLDFNDLLLGRGAVAIRGARDVA
jgi:putative DNA primase/helicase